MSILFVYFHLIVPLISIQYFVKMYVFIARATQLDERIFEQTVKQKLEVEVIKKFLVKFYRCNLKT